MTKQPFYIISACTGNPFTDSVQTAALERDLLKSGFEFKKVKGVYKGVSEDSFLVSVVDTPLEEAALKILARDFNQESILYVDGNRNATLIFVDFNNESKQLLKGKFQAVPDHVAKQLENTTFDGKDYYAVV